MITHPLIIAHMFYIASPYAKAICNYTHPNQERTLTNHTHVMLFFG